MQLLNSTRYRILDTPTGPFALMVDETESLFTAWVDPSRQAALESMRHDPSLLEDLAGRIHRFFDGDNVDFSDVPTPKATPFRSRCWEACRRIPRGETISYAALATRAGAGPGAARAAGQSMRFNPLPIIIPCHRVIAADGRLGGFAGSQDSAGAQLGHKRFLLRLERAVPAVAWS